MSFLLVRTAPSGQVKFTLFDISSVSTRVEFNLSVVDDGGAKLSVIKLFYSQDAGQTWRSTGLNCTRPGQLPNYCTRPALLPNLLPETRYLLRAQPGNEIGELCWLMPKRLSVGHLKSLEYLSHLLPCRFWTSVRHYQLYNLP